MVNKEVLDKINGLLKESMARIGPDMPLKCEPVYQDLCVIKVPKDIGNNHRDDITAIAAEIKKIPEVKAVWDFFKDVTLRGAETRNVEVEVRRKFWRRTKEDVAWEEHEDALLDEDSEEYKAYLAQRKADMLKYWQDYIIPIPPPRKNAPSELYLTMAYDPYDWIEKGFIDEDGQHAYKRSEYRSYTPNWVKRILANPPKTIKFQRGYGGPGRPAPAQMVWTVEKIVLVHKYDESECDPWNVPAGFVPQFIKMYIGQRVDKVQ